MTANEAEARLVQRHANGNRTLEEKIMFLQFMNCNSYYQPFQAESNAEHFSFYLVSKITHQTSTDTRNFHVLYIVSDFTSRPHCKKYPNHLLARNQTVAERTPRNLVRKLLIKIKVE